MLISLINHDEHLQIYPFDAISSLNELSAPHLPYITPRHEGTAPAADTTSPWNCRCKFQSSLSMYVHVTSWDGTGKCLKGSACNSYTGIHPCRLRHEPHRRAWSLSRSYCLDLGWPGGKPSIFQEWRGNGSFKLCLSWLLGQYAPVKFLGCHPGVSSWLSTFEKRYIMNIHSVSQCYTENRPPEWILADANGKAAHSLNLYCGPRKGAQWPQWCTLLCNQPQQSTCSLGPGLNGFNFQRIHILSHCIQSTEDQVKNAAKSPFWVFRGSTFTMTSLVASMSSLWNHFGGKIFLLPCGAIWQNGRSAHARLILEQLAIDKLS